MKPKSWMMLRLLMNRYQSGNNKGLLEGMNQADQQMVLSQGITSSDLIPALSGQREILSRIHYSWVAPLISNLPKEKISLILSLLPESTANKLQEYLKITVPRVKIPAPFSDFLFNQLKNQLKLEEVTPIEYLPQTSLTPLTKLKKEELVNLIDFLGIYDLSDEVKRIVDRNKLKQIYETLTPKKHDFLRQCLHLKDKLVTPKMNLEQWNGDHDKLNKVLYQRGLIRLGYALSGQPHDFIWHIVHNLDVGRGTQLLKHCNKEEIPGVSAAVTIQVLNVIKYFKG